MFSQLSPLPAIAMPDASPPVSDMPVFPAFLGALLCSAGDPLTLDLALWTSPPGSPRIPLNFAVVARHPLVQPKAVMYMSNPPVPDSEAGPIANRVRRTSNDNIQ